MTRLSVCIPTYNFGNTIGATLDSIIDQHVEDVEIVVLDSASTDDTATVVEQRRQRCAAIRYVNETRRGGIDVDMARVVELAAAETVWLFSADDLMRPGALARVLATVTSDDADVFLLSHSNCTFDMQVIVARYPILRGPTRSFRLVDAESRRRYFAAAATTEAFFSYISGLVVRRPTWRALGGGDLFIGSCWSHAARLMAGMAAGSLRIGYVTDVLVDRRGENDSFGAGGVVRRYALAIDGYTSIAETLFGRDSVEAAHVRRVLRREFGLVMFMLARRNCVADPVQEDRARLDGLFNTIYADDPRGWYRRRIYRWIAPHLFLAAFGAARLVYRLVVKKSRS